MDKEVEPYDTENVPKWIKTGSGILAFIALACIVIMLCAVVFFIVVRFGLWAFGVL